ncbi:uncharacterized protein EV422DRAFT_505476 [Fimicolochytrium jonesii]|uniref:uncharacterized protein n=1 Tax=Fimicolochytrium jonesii TaxID=1396493 RepID=UPI0022FE3148|nr:uncharacterized protein EV422DRAFT_505476 [Fimicolochytrium jonesii]KAI8822698.1 hypothetical protein EV422DRAFT_505476 [Fimicolochytrium jonesii]
MAVTRRPFSETPTRRSSAQATVPVSEPLHDYYASRGFEEDPLLQSTVKLQREELRQSIEWYRESLSHPLPQPTAYTHLDSPYEDPWTLYCYLSHDLAALRCSPHWTFTAILEFIRDAVTSPQICLDRIERVVADMGQIGEPLNKMDWDAVVASFERWGKLEHMRYMKMKMRHLTVLARAVGDARDSDPRRRGGKKGADSQQYLDSGMYRACLTSVTRRGQLLAVKQLADEMLEHCTHDQKLFQTVIQSLVDIRDSLAAYKVYEYMRSHGRIPTVSTYRALIHSLCHDTTIILPITRHNATKQTKISTLKVATAILSDAVKYHKHPKIFAAVFEVYAAHNAMSAATHLLDIMNTYAVPVDQKTCLAFFYLHLRHRRPRAARALLDALLTAKSTSLLQPHMSPEHQCRIETTHPSFHRFVLYAFIRCGLPWEAYIYFKQTLPRYTTQPLDARTCGMLIARFVRQRPDRALEVWEYMKQKGVRPGLHTRTLMEGVLRERGDEVEEGEGEGERWANMYLRSGYVADFG